MNVVFPLLASLAVRCDLAYATPSFRHVASALASAQLGARRCIFLCSYRSSSSIQRSSVQ